MGVPVPPPVVVQAPATASTGNLWWVPDAIVAALGAGLVALGVLTKTDTDLLVTAGLTTIGLAAGHMTGKQSPTP